jgi:hypothetical protein
MIKKNCWEATNCGHQPGGHNEAADGVCPASVAEPLNGIHEGKNGGRSCWAIPETLSCGGKAIESESKWEYCRKCEFYWQVMTEEKDNYASINQITRKFSNCHFIEVPTLFYG